MLGIDSDDRDRRRTSRVRARTAARHRRPHGDDRRSYAFVNGPMMVAEFTGVRSRTRSSEEPATMPATPGLPMVVARRGAGDRDGRGVAVVPPRSQRRRNPRRWPNDDPADRPCPEAGELIRRLVDRQLRRPQGRTAIVDDDAMLELRSQWATNVVTAFATIDGRPVGIVANQPMSLAGTIDIPASQKAARFVAFCDAFNLPLDHARRHARLLPGQGPRVARDDPPRRPARVRLRTRRQSHASA